MNELSFKDLIFRPKQILQIQLPPNYLTMAEIELPPPFHRVATTLKSSYNPYAAGG